MSFIAKSKGGGQDFDPIPAGMHHAICYACIDLGVQPSNNPKFKPKPKIVFIWELPEERGDFTRGEGADARKVNLPRAISSIYTLSLSEKSNLRPMLQSWRGKPFTEEELDGFDVRKVVGANCLLNIIHEVKDGKTYANVASVNPLPKAMAKKTAENPPNTFSIGDIPPGHPIKFPDNFPEWIETMIKQSEEYQERVHAKPSNQPPPAKKEAQENLDEDVPF